MRHISFIALAVLFSVIFTGNVKAAVEPNYDPSKPRVTTPWYANQGAAERAADLAFIEGMRPHHAGALTMSDDYLKDSGAKNARLMRLARGIALNQTFEIGMLDRVEHFISKPLTPSDNGKEWRQIAEQGLAQKQGFVRAPMPGPLDTGSKDVSVRDVQFAKAMIIHHQGAVDMAKDYLADPAATNKYLRFLCLDILVDQKQEIDFMNGVIARYAGNPDDVKIDESMIHGMEGMKHGGHGMKHETHAPKKKAKTKAKIEREPAHGMEHDGHH